MQLQENTLFANRYELIKLLGRGGFSEVWLAKDNWTHLRIALKVYAPGQGMDANGLQEFCGELASVYDLNHSNLLKPQHVDTWENMPYLIMAYCSEGSCAGKLGLMTEEEMWKFIHDVASGLAYLHSKDVVHQDIKPDNILIDDSGNYLITDFGVSTRARSTLRKSVVSSTAGGTTAYMGPERFSRQPAPTKASDIWSFGAMCFELLEGEVPFGEIGGGMQKGGAEIPAISSNVSDSLKYTITKMLQKETWDRPTAETLVSWAKNPSAVAVDRSLMEDDSSVSPKMSATSISGNRETQRFAAISNEGKGTQRIEYTPSEQGTIAGVTNHANNCAPQATISKKMLLLFIVMFIPSIFISTYDIGLWLESVIIDGYNVFNWWWILTIILAPICSFMSIYHLGYVLENIDSPSGKVIKKLNFLLPISVCVALIAFQWVGWYFFDEIIGQIICLILYVIQFVLFVVLLSLWYSRKKNFNVQEEITIAISNKFKILLGGLLLFAALLSIYSGLKRYNNGLSYKDTKHEQLSQDSPQQTESSVAIENRPSITVKEQGEHFLQENAKKSNVYVTSSGLQYQIIRKNIGEKPTINDRVKVHYHGTLIDGTTIDSSIERGEPNVFALNQVMQGWQEGLQLMSVGSKYKFFIPYELGFGDKDLSSTGIPPYSCLIYEVELLDILHEEKPRTYDETTYNTPSNPKETKSRSLTNNERTESYVYAMFLSTEFNLGDISEMSGVVSTTFRVRNEGMDDLLINNVSASCSCLTFDWTKSPIKPGDLGEIKVTYDPRNRPGRFQKTINVTTNAVNKPTTKLMVRGNVIS